MKKFASMVPNPRFPNAKVTYAVRDAPVPTPTYTITGVVERSGTVMSGIGVEFTSLGTVTTDGSGVYSRTVSQGYSGTSIPHYSSGSFTPANRVYTSVAANASAQDYVFYLPTGTDTVTLYRDGVFALEFIITTTTGYFAVQDDVGNVTIYTSGEAALFDYAVTFCTAWPCFSATDAYNTGSITILQKGGIQGFAGTVDLTGLPNIVQLIASEGSVNDLLVAGCNQLTDISVYNNLLGLGEVNAVLIALDANGALNGQIYITGNAAPTGGGVTAKSNLEAKGWFVVTD